MLQYNGSLGDLEITVTIPDKGAKMDLHIEWPGEGKGMLRGVGTSLDRTEFTEFLRRMAKIIS